MVSQWLGVSELVTNHAHCQFTPNLVYMHTAGTQTNAQYEQFYLYMHYNGIDKHAIFNAQTMHSAQSQLNANKCDDG